MSYPNLLYKRSDGAPLTFKQLDDNSSVTEAKINGIQNIVNINADDYTGTTYLLSGSTDLGCLLVCDTTNNALDVEIPTAAIYEFPVGSHIDILMYGTNNVTIIGSNSITLNSYQNKTTIGGQYVAVTLINLAKNEWLLVGNLV